MTISTRDLSGLSDVDALRRVLQSMAPDGSALTDSLERADEDAMVWVRVTQQNLANVWPIEDFSDWRPPDAQ